MIYKTQEAAFDLQEEITTRSRIEQRFEIFRGALGMNAEADADDLTDFECYRDMINTYEQTCGRDEYDVKFLPAFAHACQYHQNSNAAGLIATMC